MHTFTGYEPNKFVGKDQNNAPTALGPARTTQSTGSASSSSAPQQLVQADTLDDDFDRLFDESMSELFDGPLVPPTDIVVQSGLGGLAAPIGQDPLIPLADLRVDSVHPERDSEYRTPIGISSGIAVGAPKDDGHHGASSSLKKQARTISQEELPKDDGHHGKPMKQARFSTQLVISEESDKPKDDGHHGSSPSDNLPIVSDIHVVSVHPGRDSEESTSVNAIVVADRVVNLENQIALLQSKLDAKDLELSRTKVHAENYA